MKKNLLFFMLLCTPFILLAQQDAWVYLKDKQDVANSIANPTTILTQKAIDRKNRHHIVIDDRDVPVNETYISQLKGATGITVMAKSKWFNAVHVRGSEVDINNLLTSFSFIDHIEFADKSLNTSKRVQQKQQSKFTETLTTFNYGSAANQIQMIKGDQLHLANYTGTGMTVAVLDAGFKNVNTMVAFQRLRDAGNLLGDYDFVNRNDDVYTNATDNHGTLVLSTMAGYLQDPYPYVGIAPDASYYLFVTEDGPNENPVEESYWVEAAERADSLGVDVINTSLGYSNYDNPNYSYTNADMNGNTAFITKGANIAFEKGMLIVVSAGNSGNDGVGAPADSPNVLTVGAVNASGEYVSTSSVGSAIQPTQKPDVVAQGKSCAVITENDVVITTADGTSFSSPIMAGGIACLWQALPDKTNAEIMQLVRESASQYSTPDYFIGYGIPDLQLALSSTLSIDENFRDNSIYVFPNPVKDVVYFKLALNENFVDVNIFNMLGKHISHTFITPTNNQMDVSSLSSGMYLIKLESVNTSKIIKVIKH